MGLPTGLLGRSILNDSSRAFESAGSGFGRDKAIAMHQKSNEVFSDILDGKHHSLFMPSFSGSEDSIMGTKRLGDVINDFGGRSPSDTTFVVPKNDSIVGADNNMFFSRDAYTPSFYHYNPDKDNTIRDIVNNSNKSISYKENIAGEMKEYMSNPNADTFFVPSIGKINREQFGDLFFSDNFDKANSLYKNNSLLDAVSNNRKVDSSGDFGNSHGNDYAYAEIKSFNPFFGGNDIDRVFTSNRNIADKVSSVFPNVNVYNTGRIISDSKGSQHRFADSLVNMIKKTSRNLDSKSASIYGSLPIVFPSVAAVGSGLGD